MERKARVLRERAKLKLEDVVRLSSVGLGHLSRFERGEKGMGFRKLKELATLYGCTIDDLIEDAEAAPAEAGA